MIRGNGAAPKIVIGTALLSMLALPVQADEKEVQADEKELTLSATGWFTTDYVFRGISNTRQAPAAQFELDLYYGIFYAGIWGSNIDFGGTPFGDNVASIEIDYYAGITPTWMGIDFDFAALYYTYPGAFDPGANFDYWELKTAASYTFGNQLTLGLSNYWSPDFFAKTGEGNAVEFSTDYAFSGKLFNFFSPSVSGVVGYQWVRDLTDYTYWNAGLTLGFMDHWSFDVRYWDTDFDAAGCTVFSGFANNCDEHIVGTIKATF